MALILATDDTGEPEIFASVQGEGPSTGVDVAFVRLSRCNLACVWCDTPYTWHFEGDKRPHRDGHTWDRKANQVTLDEAEVARLIAAHDRQRLVITGGEPLLQASALAKMLAHLPGMAVEIETNGTVLPLPALDARIDQFNVSPKLANSGNPADLALPADRLAHWAAEPRAFFKFVIESPEDLAQVVEIQRNHAVPADRIMLMPEGTDSDTLEKRKKWLGPLCESHGFRLSDRLHIHLFGDTRGT